MRSGYLGYALVGLVLYLILGSSQLRWIALGFGIVMLLFGLLSKANTHEVSDDEGDTHQVPEEVTMEPELGLGGNTQLDEDLEEGRKNSPKKGENPIKAGGKF